MYDKYTKHAVIVMLAAQEEARRLGRTECDAENILLALAAVGDASAILTATGLTFKDIRLTLKKQNHEKDSVSVLQWIKRRFSTKGIPWADGAKKVLKSAWELAQEQGKSYADTAHLLLAIILLDEGLSKQVFVQNNVDTELMKQQILRLANA